MAVLPGVLGCRPLRRTVQVRLGTNPAVPRDELPGGTPIFFALAALRSVPQAGSLFRGLAIAIHERSGPDEIVGPAYSPRYLCKNYPKTGFTQHRKPGLWSQGKAHRAERIEHSVQIQGVETFKISAWRSALSALRPDSFLSAGSCSVISDGRRGSAGGICDKDAGVAIH
jgi:hypothetical protein